jgi:hypothetical protein
LLCAGLAAPDWFLCDAAAFQYNDPFGRDPVRAWFPALELYLFQPLHRIVSATMASACEQLSVHVPTLWQHALPRVTAELSQGASSEGHDQRVRLLRRVQDHGPFALAMHVRHGDLAQAPFRR